MAVDLYDLIFQWQNYGIFDIALPFLLIFTLSYAVLDKTKILGKKNKNINIIVALVLGFLFLQNPFLLASLQGLLPNVSFALVVLLLFLLIVGVLMGDKYAEWKGMTFNVAALIAVIALIWAMFTQPGLEYGGAQDIIYNFLGPEALPLVAFLLIVIVAIAAVRGKESS